MSLPTPNNGEKQSSFLSRCMGSGAMQSEYSDKKQRVAVCYSQWTKSKKSMDPAASLDNDIHMFVFNREQFPTLEDATTCMKSLEGGKVRPEMSEAHIYFKQRPAYDFNTSLGDMKSIMILDGVTMVYGPLKKNVAIPASTGESRESYIARCADNEAIRQQYKTEAERTAICGEQFDASKSDHGQDGRSVEHSMKVSFSPEQIKKITDNVINSLRLSFDHSKSLSDATLGEYSEALHTGWKRDDPFRKKIEEFLGEGYTKIMRLSEEIEPYKANLFRFGFQKTIPTDHIASVTNYGYDEEEPPGFMTYSTGTDVLDGYQNAVLCLSHNDHKIVLRINEGPYGELYLNLYGKEKSALMGFLKDIKDGMDANNFLKKKKLFWNGSFITPGKVSLNDVILPEGFRKAIDENVIHFFDRTEELQAKGLPQKRGVLIYGQPGNGKSMLGKAIANEVDCTFIWVPYDANLAHVYKMARELAPSIVLLEDLASQGGMDRRGGPSSYELGKLLNLLDGVEENTGVITLATENFVDNLDVALRNRPGRFDIILQLGNPELEQRERFLANYMPGFAPGRILSLGHDTEGFSGAHLRELVSRILIKDATPDMDQGIIEDIRKTFGIALINKEK